MTQEQGILLRRASDSLRGAKLLATDGLHGFAASRAYYAMFYVAQAFLLGLGLSYSKHSAVIAAFGRECAHKGTVPVEFHQFLIKAKDARNVGDYSMIASVTAKEAAEQIARAEKFLQLGKGLVGPIPPADEPHR